MPNCKKCKGARFFHVGDKVTFGGNKTHHSHRELRPMAEDAGLIFTGRQKSFRAVILNPNSASKRSVDQARRMSSTVLTPDEFVEELKRICRGNLPPEPKKRTLKAVLARGGRVYLLGLTKSQQKSASEIVKKLGGTVAIRRTPNLTAVIYSTRSITSGRIDLYRLHGIPVYQIERIRY